MDFRATLAVLVLVVSGSCVLVQALISVVSTSAKDSINIELLALICRYVTSVW